MSRAVSALRNLVMSAVLVAASTAAAGAEFPACAWNADPVSTAPVPLGVGEFYAIVPAGELFHVGSGSGEWHFCRSPKAKLIRVGADGVPIDVVECTNPLRAPFPAWTPLVVPPVAGPRGIRGLMGATGPTGATGATGPPGETPRVFAEVALSPPGNADGRFVSWCKAKPVKCGLVFGAVGVGVYAIKRHNDDGGGSGGSRREGERPERDRRDCYRDRVDWCGWNRD